MDDIEGIGQVSKKTDKVIHLEPNLIISAQWTTQLLYLSSF